MIRLENPQRIVFGSSTPDIPDTPYGLPFIRGERVDISFGTLDSSVWCAHSFERTRFVFTFDRAGGWIKTMRSERAWPEGHFFFEPHQFCIVPPNLETIISWEEPADLVILYYDSPAIAEGGPSFNKAVVGSLHPIVRRDPEISKLLQMFLKLCRETSQPKTPYVEGIGMALASRALEQLASPSKPDLRSRHGFHVETIERASRYIDARLKETILVSDLAKLAAVSPDHFARRFKVSTGLSPKQFLIRHRIEKACQLFKTGEYNVTEAAHEVGFHDLSYLNRCFRKFKGCSPKGVLKGVGNAVSY
jgi:AraC-like DNA-binding protein